MYALICRCLHVCGVFLEGVLQTDHSGCLGMWRWLWVGKEESEVRELAACSLLAALHGAWGTRWVDDIGQGDGSRVVEGLIIKVMGSQGRLQERVAGLLGE